MTNPISGMFFFIISVAALACVFAIFKMKFDAATRLAKHREDGDASYRELATQAIKLQELNSALLSDIAARLASVEKMLKDVA